MAIDRTNKELEFKCFITLEQYNALLEEFGLTDNVFLQTNYYFDNENLDVKNNNQVLRIRKKGEQYKLTSKTHVESKGSLENHVFLTKEQALDMIENGFDASIINIPFYVKNICQLDTYRACAPYKDGKIFFDKSTYYNHTDYEIEYEVCDLEIGRKVFLQFLNNHNIKETKVISKSKRAYMAVLEKK